MVNRFQQSLKVLHALDWLLLGSKRVAMVSFVVRAVKKIISNGNRKVFNQCLQALNLVNQLVRSPVSRRCLPEAFVFSPVIDATPVAQAMLLFSWLQFVGVFFGNEVSRHETFRLKMVKCSELISNWLVLAHGIVIHITHLLRLFRTRVVSHQVMDIGAFEVAANEGRFILCLKALSIVGSPQGSNDVFDCRGRTHGVGGRRCIGGSLIISPKRIVRSFGK